MNISAKTDYACRALIELALHWPKKNPVPMTIIAKKQRIPIKFLNQILLNLKQFGYVNSIRGKEGGYSLAVPPRDIKLLDIITHFESKGDGGKRSLSSEESSKAMASIWQEIDTKITEIFSSVTLEDIKNRVQGLQKVTMFSI